MYVEIIFNNYFGEVTHFNFEVYFSWVESFYFLLLIFIINTYLHIPDLLVFKNLF